MKNDRVKILQLLPDYHENSHNYSDLAEQIAAAFPQERYEVTSAFIRGKPEPGHPASRAERTVYFDFPHEALSGLRMGLPRKIHEFLRQGGFDVVICHRFKLVNLLMWLNRLSQIPVCVGISHGFGEYDAFWRRIRMRLLVDDAWHFVAVSPAVRQYLLDRYCGFTEDNTTAILNAIDIDQAEAEQYSREVARQKLGLPAEGRIIGAIGRLVRIKGHIHLIRAFARIGQKHPDTHLAIIGEGKEESALRQEIVRLGLQGKIHLPGFFPGAKRYVRAFDLWTMPSLKEGLGLALLEGMCGRLPIIASRIPAMTPLVEGAGGTPVPPADVEAWAAALDTYLSLPSLELVAKGQKAYEYLRKSHGIEEYRAKYLMLVETVLSHAKKQGAHG
ncbi:MAG: glycosyltransferase family 4 protein [Zoogloeaceae bacterium]|jgi:glycosyltransferase involved in cell wall biosynthesis|nr:glycosyltransferase family 4 protein [Zoogloeaceae bacterium]